MTTKLKPVEEYRQQFIEEECETMDGDDGRYSVYENDGDLVAKWWLELIIRDRHTIYTALREIVADVRKTTADRNQALDRTLTLLDELFGVSK